MSSEWVDVNGSRWRFSTVTGSWLKLVNGSWKATPLPSGGLQRVTPGATSPNVVIVETMGPPGPPGPPGPGAADTVSEILPAQDQDGVNDSFLLSSAVDVSGTIQVFRNGLLEVRGQSYELVNGNTVTFTTPPLDDDVIAVVYQKAQ